MKQKQTTIGRLYSVCCKNDSIGRWFFTISCHQFLNVIMMISVRFSLSNLPSKSANFFNQHLVIYIRLPHVAVQSFITNLSTIADYRQSIDFISLRLSKFAILLTK